MDKENVGHRHNGVLFRYKKKTNSTIWNNMDGSRGIMIMKLARQRKANTKLFYLHMEYKNKAKQKEQNSSRLIDTEKGLVVTKGEWGGIKVHYYSQSQCRLVMGTVAQDREYC